MEAPAESIGLRYLTRFRCIAAACEDPCCIDWSVPLDEANLAALSAAMSGSAEEQAELRRALVHQKDPSRKTTALLALREDQSCVMLDADRLCSLQRRYGEAVLPDVCAVYPRVMNRVQGRLELTGSLSCPEAARLCLLHEDATDLVPIDAALLPRRHLSLQQDQPRSLAEAAFDDVQALALELLSQRRYPVASRLFFLCAFAAESRALLRPDAGRAEGLRLHRLLGLLRQPEVQEQLHEQLAATEVDETFAASVVAQLLQVAWTSGHRSFQRLLAAALAPYAADPAGGVTWSADGAPRMDPAALHGAYRRRRAPLPPALERRIDLSLENFCKNHWVKDWYLRSPSLLAHAILLLVRVAALQFLLRSHPAPAAAPEATPDALDAAAVQVCYTFCRVADHHGKLMKAVEESLVEQGMITLPHAVCLIKF